MTRLVFCVVHVGFCILLSGCAAAGVVAYKLMGPPPIPAKYTPDKTVPMLILVENYKNATATQAHAELLSTYLAEALNTVDVAPLVPEEKLRELRDARPAEFPQMSVAAIAQATGAGQVLYVELLSSDVNTLTGAAGSADSLQAHAQATVKMIDGKTGHTLWPLESESGYPVSAGTSLGAAGGSPVEAMDVRQSMYRALALEITHLIHKWQPQDSRPEE